MEPDIWKGTQESEYYRWVIPTLELPEDVLGYLPVERVDVGYEESKEEGVVVGVTLQV